MAARTLSRPIAWRFWLFAAMVACALVGLATPASPQSAAPRAVVLEIDGAIGPASASYVTGGLRTARDEGASLVIIKMDTPGGLDVSMREIIREMLGMPVPVVAYVHPSGARAASAGTYILYASHVAAMTPGTNLGAATPVQLGGVPSTPSDEDEESAAPQSASERKALNDSIAYIRSLAEMRGRNAEWAELAVREAASLSANAALAEGVIDVVADDVPSLLRQIDGMTVTVDGAERVLETGSLAISEIEPDWATRILAVITDPNIALILMMIGVYGLLFEFMNPGALYPGTIGAISLLIGLYALAALPLDAVGVVLILLGIGLMTAEAFAPSFGILGIGGVVAFGFGAAILVDTDVPDFQIDWSIIAALGVFSAGLIVLIGRLALSSRRGRIQTGQDELVGAVGRVMDWQGGTGHVFVRSERWNARGPAALEQGDSVIVESIDGLCLEVAPQPDPPPEP